MHTASLDQSNSRDNDLMHIMEWSQVLAMMNNQDNYIALNRPICTTLNNSLTALHTTLGLHTVEY